MYRLDGLLVFGLLLGCSPPGTETVAEVDAAYEPSVEEAVSADEGVLPPVVTAGQEELSQDLMARLNQAWTGDFDGMVERRVIRALVPYSRTFYFLDGAEPKGIAYDAMKAFEGAINENLGTGHLKVHVVVIPVARDELLPGLVEGRGDLAAANLTITPERRNIVDFSDPVLTGVDEIIVTGPSAPPLQSLDDLAGREVHVRPSSSYFESLRRLDETFADSGRPRLVFVEMEEVLEDEDLLEMVNAGLIPAVVVDTHKADFWAQIFDDITPRHDLAVRTGGEIAWAFRKASPGLATVVNDFVRENRKGTLLGNILFKRYLKNTKWVEGALAGQELEKLGGTIDLFKKYGERYELDWLLVAALAYQESRLDQGARSHVGAVGIMQLLPSTAADRNVNIPNIDTLEGNIHAGTKYLRFLLDRYFNDEEIDSVNQFLLTAASYNAGPARVARLRRKAESRGLDPNKWFRNVEVVAAEDIGRETVQYVSNIFKYYVAYRQVASQMQKRRQI